MSALSLPVAERRRLAFALHAGEIPVLPLPPGAKFAPPAGWRVMQASNQSPEEVEQFAEEGNIAMPTGQASGIVVVDLDFKPHDGETAEQARQRVLTELGIADIVTPAVITPSGGVHIYFQAPEGVALKNSAKTLHPEVDVRAEGGYVVCPGSELPNGQYSWAPGRSDEIDLAPLPQHLLDKMIAVAPAGEVEHIACETAEAAFEALDTQDRRHLENWACRTMEKIVAGVAGAEEGKRNDTLNGSAFRLYKIANAGMLDPDDVDDKLQEAGAACGLDGAEVTRTLRSASRSAAGKATDVDELIARLKAPTSSSASVRAYAGRKAAQQLSITDTILTDNSVDFPIEQLPKVLKDFAHLVSREVQVPIAAVVPAMLGVLSALVRRSTNGVMVGSRQQATLLWFLVGMPPGSRKSAIFERVFDPFMRRMLELKKKFEEEDKINKQSQRAVDNLIDAALKPIGASTKKERAEISNEDRMLHGIVVPDMATAAKLAKQRPEDLPNPTILASTATPEAIIKKANQTGGDVFIAADEGGILGALADEKGRAQNLNILLKGYDASLYIDETIAHGTQSVEEPAITIALYVQTLVLGQALGNQKFNGTGLMTRFIYDQPPDTVGTRKAPGEADGRNDTPEASNWATLVRNLYTDKPRDDVMLKISGEAYGIWSDYFDKIESGLAPEQRFAQTSTLREWASKHPDRVARLAALLHAAERGGNLTERQISAETMRAACAIGDYWAHRAEQMLVRSPDVAEEDLVVQWIEERTTRSGETLVGDLYEDFERWCAAEDEDTLDRKVFGKRLTEVGVSFRKTSGERWRGLVLKEVTE